MAVTRDGKTLVCALQEAKAMGFADVALRKEIGHVDAGGPAMSLSLSPDGQTAYTGIQEQDKIVEISVSQPRVVRTFATPKGSGPDPVIPLF